MDEGVFLSALRVAPSHELTWQALADWLDDDGQTERAELVRLTRRLRGLSFGEGEPLRGRARGLLDAGVEPALLTLTNSLGMGFVLVEAGTFLMGSPRDEQGRSRVERQSAVTITRPFWIGVHQVTQEQYEHVMGVNPSDFKGLNRPVETVAWGECVEFCKQLGEMAAEKAEKRLYRLPTEAEWEYACRGGAAFFSPLPFHFRQPSASLSATQANFDGKYPYGGAPTGERRKQTTEVGAFEPNALGIHDMHGNVYEWCSDWYGKYSAQAVSDPAGPPEGTRRVMRGGDWHHDGRHCRAADRNYASPDAQSGTLGFRVTLVAVGQEQG
jgi:uncharacterized protein (TIGR02996 family)